jgi:hypothetical protein
MACFIRQRRHRQQWRLRKLRRLRRIRQFRLTRRTRYRRRSLRSRSASQLIRRLRFQIKRSTALEKLYYRRRQRRLRRI